MADWQVEMRNDLARLVDAAVTGGASHDEVFALLKAECARLQAGAEADPDPADHPSELVVDEPANDWPSAER